MLNEITNKMNCPSCKNTVFEADTKCEICGFPLKGSEKEKARFIGLKYAKKMAGGDSDKTVAIARFSIFVEAAIHVAFIAVPYMFGIFPIQSVHFALIFAIVMISLGIVAKNRPIIGFSIALPIVSIFLILSFLLISAYRHDTHLLLFVYIDILIKLATIVLLILGIVKAAILAVKDGLKK